MNTPTQFQRQWQQISTQSEPSGRVKLSTDNGELECVVSDVTPIAGNVQRIEYTSERLRSASPDALEQVGRNLIDRVGYLMEPLAFVEVDGQAGEVQVRSAPPARTDSEVRYYEASISSQRGIQFQRYRAPRGEERAAMPAPLTREVLERLVDDCIGSVDDAIAAG